MGRTYEWRLTQQLAASDQVANSHVEISRSARPVGDFCERVGGQDILKQTTMYCCLTM